MKPHFGKREDEYRGKLSTGDKVLIQLRLDNKLERFGVGGLILKRMGHFTYLVESENRTIRLRENRMKKYK
jgi:hypothetical protein